MLNKLMYRGFWENLNKPIIGLAPMDGVSDAAFRFITAKYGSPSVLITEFTNVDALHHGAAKALTAFIHHSIETPIVAQIYGTNPANFYQATIVVCELGFDGVDINMGCPSKSVSGNGAGAGLIRTPKLAQEIINAVKQATFDWANGKTMEDSNLHPNIIKYIQSAQSGIWPTYYDSNNIATNFYHTPPIKPTRKILPVSVKTRIGYDQPITEEWLKYIVECEPANISLHGRTLKQMYTGLANWEEIEKAAKFVHAESPQMTLLGNGDVKNLEDAKDKIKQYGVDGVLIGRSSFGQPWILKGENRNSLEKLHTAIEHAEKYEEIFGIGDKSFSPMKKHLGWYCTDFPGAKELRLKLMTCHSSTELKKVINHFISENTGLLNN